MSFHKRDKESVKEVLSSDYYSKHHFIIFISPLDELFIYRPIYAKGFAAQSLFLSTLPILLEWKPNRTSRPSRGVAVLTYYNIT